jgi:hypothetical protein
MNLLPDIWQCCGEQPTHIFIYENGQIFLICSIHFKSTAHRAFVKDVIDYKSRKRLYPNEIFGEAHYA